MHAIFQALFGKRRVRSGPKERYGGNWDDEEEDEDAARGGEDEEVDESWIKTGISLSLFSSKAVDFACRFVVCRVVLSRERHFSFEPANRQYCFFKPSADCLGRCAGFFNVLLERAPSVVHDSFLLTFPMPHLYVALICLYGNELSWDWRA